MKPVKLINPITVDRQLELDAAEARLREGSA